jgi:hypothetical protein
MVNPFKEVNWNPTLPDKRKFAVSLIIGFPCLAVVLLLVKRLASGVWIAEPSLWLGGIGVGLGLFLWILPAVAKPFYLIWYFLACCIGIVVGNVLLAGFFFVVVTPIGLALRAVGKAPLKKAFRRPTATYWHDVEPVSDVKRYYNQF